MEAFFSAPTSSVGRKRRRLILANGMCTDPYQNRGRYRTKTHMVELRNGAVFMLNNAQQKNDVTVVNKIVDSMKNTPILISKFVALKFFSIAIPASA